MQEVKYRMNFFPVVPCSGVSFPLISPTQLSHSQVLTRQSHTRRPRAGRNSQSANVNKQNIPLQSNTTMSTSCCLNHRWALLNANLFPVARYRRFALPQCSELGCPTSCDFRALLHSTQTRPNTPWWPSPARSWAGFPRTRNTCCRATPALSHQFAPAAEKESTETPFTPRPMCGPALPPPLSNYVRLNFLHHCLFSMFDCCQTQTLLCLYCWELFADFWEESALHTTGIL